MSIEAKQATRMQELQQELIALQMLAIDTKVKCEERMDGLVGARPMAPTCAEATDMPPGDPQPMQTCIADDMAACIRTTMDSLNQMNERLNDL